MSAILLQSLLVGKGMPKQLNQNARAPNGKKGEGKLDFLKLMSQLLPASFSQGTLAEFLGGDSADSVPGATRQRAANLFLKLKTLGRELSQNPQMGRQEKQQLLLRLRIKEDLDELTALPPQEKLSVFNWLKAQLGSLENQPSLNGAEPSGLAEKIIAMLDAAQGTPGEKPASSSTSALVQPLLAEENALDVGTSGKKRVVARQASSAAIAAPAAAGSEGAVLSSANNAENGVSTGHSTDPQDGAILRCLQTLLGLEGAAAASQAQASGKAGKKQNKTASPRQNLADNPREGEASEPTPASQHGDQSDRPIRNQPNSLQFSENIFLLAKPKPKFILATNAGLNEGSQLPTADQGKETKPTNRQILTLSELKLETNQLTEKPPTAAKESSGKQTAPDPFKVVDQVIKSVKAEIAPGVSRIEIQLEPKHLGKVSVIIVMENNQLSAKLTTQNVVAREVLQQNLAQLKEALQSQGIEVENLNVNLGDSGESHFAFQRENSKPSAQTDGFFPLEPLADEDTEGFPVWTNPQLINAGQVDYLI